MDQQTVTNEAYNLEMGSNTSVEETGLKNFEVASDSSQYNLSDYVSSTWDCGVYTSEPSVAIRAKESQQRGKKGSQQQIAPQNSAASISRTLSAHVRNATEAYSSGGVRDSANKRPVSSQGRTIVPQSIKNWKGLLRMTVRSRSDEYASAKAQIAHDEISNSSLENEAANNDLTVAKHLLRKEIRKKSNFQMRIKASPH